MERLTTRNDMGIAVLKQPYRCERCGEETWSLSDHGNGEPIDKLAEYEELEEQGKLLKLQCAVGDTVYTLNTLPSGRTIIGELEADEFFCALCAVNGRFGKTAFLTHEEAEKARNQLN